ncbi:MAG TPA: aldo/keto reductase [Roseiflexaceae bacterium]
MIARSLGATGPRVSAIGLGCRGMSDLYGPADEAESIATIHAVLDAGITLLDTGDFYGMGNNELLIRAALQGRAGDQKVSAARSRTWPARRCSLAPITAFIPTITSELPTAPCWSWPSR